jgi:hypothetical protein
MRGDSEKQEKRRKARREPPAAAGGGAVQNATAVSTVQGAFKTTQAGFATKQRHIKNGLLNQFDKYNAAPYHGNYSVDTPIFQVEAVPSLTAAPVRFCLRSFRSTTNPTDP